MKKGSQRTLQPDSFGARGPGAALARGCGFKSSTELAAAFFALQIVGLTTILHLKLQPVTPDEALYRARAVTRQMNQHLAVEKAIRLGPQP